jgi:hypothetical protein
MAAALAVRDYEGTDQNDVLEWAKAILHRAAAANEKEYLGNDQIEYSERAIAAVGFISLYFKDQDTAARDALLGLAAHDHGAVLNSIGQP